MGFSIVIVNGSEPNRVAVEDGEWVYAVLQRERIRIPASCGGQKTCGKCRVTVRHKGSLDVRLACATFVEEGMIVEVAPEKPLVVCDSGKISLAAVYPPDFPLDFSPDCPPEFSPEYPPDFSPDAGAARAAGAAIPSPSLSVPSPSCPNLGVAVDIGTTTVVARLLDCTSGEMYASVADINPQVLYGADVLSRIDACTRGNLAILTSLIRERLARLIEELLSQAALPDTPASKIRRIAITGNTIMEHIVAGLSPESIGVSPFAPLSLFGDERLLAGLDAPVWLAPTVSGYIGGDIVCGLLATGTLGANETFLFIDLGTNGELALFDGQRIHCCSTAAGPVFEGGGVYFGMPALPGAITHVALSIPEANTQDTLSYFTNADNTAAQGTDACFELTTIGGIEARGLCGTGLISTVAAFLKSGLIDATGMVQGAQAVDPELACLLGRETVNSQSQAAIYLTKNRRLFITQGDIRNLQLAKAAVLAGIKTMLEAACLDVSDVKRVAIAGAFGAALDITNASRIGLIPPELSDCAQSFGNTAIEGISAALLSSRARADLAALAKRCDYIELSTSLAFNRYFLDCVSFDCR